MSAVLQFEANRKRLSSKESFVSDTAGLDSPDKRLLAIGFTAVKDTLRNGGTFVLIVTDETVTMVQRADAEDLE